MLDVVRNAALGWYVFTSSLTAGAWPAFRALDARIGVPLVSALLLGILGAAAPCQLTQSLGMISILARHGGGGARWQGAVAYLAGKSLVYTGLGVLAVLLGAGLAEVSIPVFVAIRKAIGPLMIVVGLTMIGVVRLPWLPGARLAARVRVFAASGATANGTAFLLGVAFGFAFCPTLFALFAGFLIPLALTRPDGVVYPAFFAVGTALPLLAALGLLSVGVGVLKRQIRSIGRAQRWAGVAAGLTLVLVGVNDTIVYWLL
jgi:cytochrome c-type biogenesis protein